MAIITTPQYFISFPTGLIRVSKTGVTVWAYDGTLRKEKSYLLPKNCRELAPKEFVKCRNEWKRLYSDKEG